MANDIVAKKEKRFGSGKFCLEVIFVCEKQGHQVTWGERGSLFSNPSGCQEGCSLLLPDLEAKDVSQRTRGRALGSQQVAVIAKEGRMVKETSRGKGVMSQETYVCSHAREGGQAFPPSTLGPEELGPSDQRGLRWGPGGRGGQTPGHGHITSSLLLGSRKEPWTSRSLLQLQTSTSTRGAGSAWLSVSPCAEDTRDSEVDISFIFLFDLKHVRTRNVTRWCVTNRNTGQKMTVFMTLTLLLPQQLVFGEDQALSACHFQYRVVT